MFIPYTLLGRIFVYLAVAVIILTLISLLLGTYSYKKNKSLFPNFIFFMLYFFYSPAKLICRTCSIKESIVDDIIIEVGNAVMLERFKQVDGKCAVILPQCLRHPNCKARCDPITGYECEKCGLCDIAPICEAAEKYNFKVFVVPGDSFVRKIIKSYRPHACIGVACHMELTESMQEISKYMPVQGVWLLKDGCYNTEVDVDEVIRKMEMCNNNAL
ncbi:DUF116 domain-containing protein [Methanohalobium sp.]|uniref:DUF116 domain-containing protein n=1 Tax=Methanohalobium sp. TaxID=2837493 RepID=UPI0025CD2F9E|nr:DUF116 domain-containing protein [Methanohalobium sp.]